jgi:hypothetical protein
MCHSGTPERVKNKMAFYWWLITLNDCKEREREVVSARQTAITREHDKSRKEVAPRSLLLLGLGMSVFLPS